MSATRNPRRGWRALLWGLGLFVLGQLVAGIVLDRYRLPVRFAVLARQLDRLQAGPTPDVVLLGSSRTGSVVHDAELTRLLRAETGEPNLRAYNSAVPVGDLIVAELAIADLLDRGIRPRLVVLELVPEGVALWNPWHAEHIHRQGTWADVPGSLLPVAGTGNLGRLLLARLLPVYAFRKEIVREIGPGERPPEPAPDDLDAGSALDWSRIVVAPPRDPDDVQAHIRAGLHGVRKDLAGYTVAGPGPAALERTLTRLRAEGIPVVLLGVPVAAAHREQYTPAIESRFQAYLAELHQRFGVRYLDCRAALPDELFQDHHHAIPAGSVRFAGILAREYLGPYWREHLGTAQARR